MNVLVYLFLIKNVLAQDWQAKHGIDFSYLYREEFDKPDGLESESNSVGNLISPVENGINERDEIERPCKIYDKNCIRRYFAAHSLCTPKYQPIANPVYRTQSTFYFSRVNITVSPIDIYYRGAGGRIIEFYINKKTNRLVIAFTFDNFTISSDNAYFRFNRRAKEPVVTRTSLNVLYVSATATVIIPNLNNLRLDKSEVFANSETPAVVLIINPSILGNGNPSLAAALVEFLLRPDVNLQEAFLFDANYFAHFFIQQSICDFGLIQS